MRVQPAHSGASNGALKALCASSYRTLVNEVMSYLIQSVWIEGEAKRARCSSVSAAQIDASYAAQLRLKSQPPLSTPAELDAFLAKSGQTQADLKWRTQLNLLATAIQRDALRHGAPVTPAKIRAYYAAHLRASPARASRRDPQDP